MTSFPPSIVLQRVGQDPPDSHRMPFCDQPVPWLACTPWAHTGFTKSAPEPALGTTRRDVVGAPHRIASPGSCGDVLSQTRCA